MGWDWVKILKEEMLDLKPDEHLSRHAATDRLAWVSSQAPARAPVPAEEWRDFRPNTPPAGGALLGWADDQDASESSRTGFNSGPLYGAAEQVDSYPPPEPPPAEVPPINHFDFAMPTAPPMEYPVPQAPVGDLSGAAVPPMAGLPMVRGFRSDVPPVEQPSFPSSGPFARPVDDVRSLDPLAGPAAPAAYSPSGYSPAGYGSLPASMRTPGPGAVNSGANGTYDALAPDEQGYVLTLVIDGVLAGVALPTGAEVTVGRERASTLVVPEAKQTVSRRAVTLVRTARRSVEATIGNRNGAWVTRQMPEGTRQEFVERGHSVTLRVGDRLALDPPGTVVVGLGEPH